MVTLRHEVEIEKTPDGEGVLVRTRIGDDTVEVEVSRACARQVGAILINVSDDWGRAKIAATGTVERLS